MGRNSDFIPKTYSIKGYTRKGHSFGEIVRFIAYLIGSLALLTAISVFLIFAI